LENTKRSEKHSLLQPIVVGKRLCNRASRSLCEFKAPEIDLRKENTEKESNSLLHNSERYEGPSPEWKRGEKGSGGTGGWGMRRNTE